MSKAKELAEQMFPEPQMENYDDILEYRNDRDWTFIARGAVVKGYEQAKEEMMKDAIDARVLAIGQNAIVKEENEDNLRKYLLSKFHNGDKVKVIIIKE